MIRPARILPVIVISQFAGTSLWFAGNAVLPELQKQWNLGTEAIGYVTSAVQFGFIFGTLFFAFFNLSDRFSPRIIFFTCSVLGALFNIFLILFGKDITSLIIFRFITGFFLAGIYPVGMKIAAGWYEKGLGNAIGFLVGALVLGTAFPHLLKSIGSSFEWKSILLFISVLALSGGLLMLFLVPDGPYLLRSSKFNAKAIYHIFKIKELRSAAFGYFGHMWELYAFWAFIPFFLSEYSIVYSINMNTSFWSFLIIAAGSIGCIAGGIISVNRGSAGVAFAQLLASGICCVLSPLLFHTPAMLFLVFLILWGIVVVGDSPQFSALTALAAPKEFVGTALTIVNCIGFTITIFSIQLLNYLVNVISIDLIFLFLAIGPLFGLINLYPSVKLYKKRNS